MNKKDFKSKESKRVKAYRKQKSKEGFRNISFMVNPEEYQEIETARENKGLTTKELMFYYLRGQYLREGRYHWQQYSPEYDQILYSEKSRFNLLTIEGFQNQLELDQRLGESFQLKTGRREKKYQTFVIAEFIYKHPKKHQIDYFPYRWSCPNKGYESLEEAIEAYLLKKPKLRKNHQHVLLRKKPSECYYNHPIEQNWYDPVLMLKELYPGQIYLMKWVSDLTDYQAVYDRIRENMINQQKL